LPVPLFPMDGVFLSPPEDEFVGRISEELEHFLLQGQHQRVLLFPPLSSRLRYLIHRTVENMDLLSSFSVGEGWRRRTVICHSAVRLPSETTGDPKAGANPARPPRPAQPWGRGNRGLRPRPPGDGHGEPPRGSVGSGRITRPARRKPERGLFMPRGGRRKANWREREAEPGEDAAQGAGKRPGNSRQELGQAGGSPGGGSGKQQEPGEGSGSGEEEKAAAAGNGGDCGERRGRDGACAASPAAGHGQHPAQAAEQRSSPANAAAPQGSAFLAQLSPPSRDGRAPERGESALGRQSWTGEDKDVAEALWKGLDLAAGDAEGTRQSGLEDDCTAELLAEIVGNLRVKDISIERVPVDLCSSGEAQLSEGDLGHVTEIYDFPSSLKTEDLLEMFSDFHESGLKIHWVDDTHALGIFSSLSTASQALGRRYPCLKIRPLIHASKQSKIRALQRPKLLQLDKERPQTDTAVARRLVSHALGWKQKQQEPSGPEVFQPEPLEQEE
ncbi:R3HC1 protein, partial [Climacteris rufus]|nr:R3HC1 protein [Climacteris rufus]